MDPEQTDGIDIGVVAKLSESFSSHVSLVNPVPVTEQKISMKIKDCKEKEPKEGDCHIFNYQDFKSLSPRTGSEKDAARLEHDFKQLNFDVYLHLNLSYEETSYVLKKASKKDYSKSKYFICCFLTHGDQNGVLWTKDKTMCINDILLGFSKSSSLKEIPKIFIIEACQGKEAELAVSTDTTDSGFAAETEFKNFLDFLIINSTYVDTVSFRTRGDKEEDCHGTYFIDEFCRSLEEFSCNLDLLQILTIVNSRMANTFLNNYKDSKELDRKKQMPCFMSTIRKNIKFNRYIKPFVSDDTKVFDRRRKRYGSRHDNVNDPLSNIYNIRKASKVLFLSLMDKNIGQKDSLLRSAIYLRGYFAGRNYSHKAFEKKFIRSEIRKFLNQSSNQFGTKNEFKSKKSSEVDCLICYIAAYSRYDFIHDAGGRIIAKKEIVKNFIGELNKSFVGKPKIFIFLLRELDEDENLPGEKFCDNIEPVVASSTNIEARCRSFNLGTDCVDAANYPSNDPSDRGFNINSESSDGNRIEENLIPIHADILEICITVTDWEDSIGPMNLFQEILEKSSNKDLLSLLTEFNYQLDDKHNFFQLSKKSSFSVSSTLTKTLFLP